MHQSEVTLRVTDHGVVGNSCDRDDGERNVCGKQLELSTGIYFIAA